jgi:hypothetical protein
VKQETHSRDAGREKNSKISPQRRRESFLCVSLRALQRSPRLAENPMCGSMRVFSAALRVSAVSFQVFPRTCASIDASGVVRINSNEEILYAGPKTKGNLPALH